MKKKWLFLPLCLAVATALAGCGPINLNLRPDVPNLHIYDRMPVRVALLVPESTRNFSMGIKEESGCLGQQDIAPMKSYGEVFEETVNGVFSQIFKETVLVRQPRVQGYDFTVEATMDYFSYRLGCLISPPIFSYTVKGGMRVLDSGGREIWRSKTTSKKVDINVMPMAFSPAGIYEQMAKDISAVIASLAGGWGYELKTSPDVQQLAMKKAPTVVMTTPISPSGVKGASPNKFYSAYENNPKLKREWMKLDDSRWIESYPDGTVVAYKVIGSNTVDEQSGVVVRRLPDEKLDVFIPDMGNKNMWTSSRKLPDGEWKYVSAMEGIGDSSTTLRPQKVPSSPEKKEVASLPDGTLVSEQPPGAGGIPEKKVQP
ncbi:MAG: hypothetical protein FJ139_00310, partial [Deltaproteobacteria bacterium]|nr:hypothetical protein [Deltaproteobacteria bacterium]